MARVIRLDRLAAWLWAGALLLTLAQAGCGDPTSSTSLHPEGEPVILQVFVKDRVRNPETGMVSTRYDPAYGTHPLVPRDPAVTPVANALPDPVNQQIRIVFDELLRGNELEEVRCADGMFEKIPLGLTPDDLADCAGPPDVIRTTCTADLCQRPDGPAGILDEDLDGAADEFRFIADNVNVTCGGIRMGLDVEGEFKTFWQPAGNQQIPNGPNGFPTQSEIERLGPAIVVWLTEGLRTGSNCTITFAEQVVDKDGIRPCAPAPGEVCRAGDTSGIQFTTDALRVTTTVPFDGQGLTPDDPQRANPVPLQPIIPMRVTFNARIDVDTPSAIEVTADGNVITNYTATVVVDTSFSTITIRLGDGTTPVAYDPDTTYEVSISGTRDVYGGELPETFSYRFLSASLGPDAGVPDAGPDAGPPDAGVDAMP